MILHRRPIGLPQAGDLLLAQTPMPEAGDGELLLKALYISVDPYLRGKMSGTKTPRFELGEPVSSKIIAEVIESRNGLFDQGTFVAGYLPWKAYQASDGTGLAAVDPAAAPLSAYLGVLGVTGLSAYFALLDIGKPKAGETLVVSGAAGAVGSIAGQIGKIMGCRVVGITGTDEKAALLTARFGFDEAINYKTCGDLKAAVALACPGGIDIYFDNVGGTISDAVIANINKYGRIAACGAISHYNDTEESTGPSLLPIVVYKFLSIKGFLIGDLADRFPEGIARLTAWLKSGELQYTETIMEGFGRLPEAFAGLFEGRNEGKMIVKV